MTMEDGIIEPDSTFAPPEIMDPCEVWVLNPVVDSKEAR